jgi:nitroreductase
MNETLKTIASRRSIRQFKQEQIKDSELHSILEAGLQAPSGHNDQPWFFSVIQNKDLIKELSDGSKEEMKKSDIDWMVTVGKNERLNIYYNAPTIIIVAGRKDAVTPMADVCGAIQNMLIAAESLNIGACWIGFTKYNFTKEEEYKKVKIPDDYEVYYGIALGYKVKGDTASPPARKYVKYFEVIK